MFNQNSPVDLLCLRNPLFESETIMNAKPFITAEWTLYFFTIFLFWKEHKSVACNANGLGSASYFA